MIVNLQDDHSQKKQELSNLLNKNVKRTLVRSHYVSLQDMDAPTQLFFYLNKCFFILTICMHYVHLMEI